MMLRLFFLLCVLGLSSAGELQEIFNWKNLKYAWPNEQVRNHALQSGTYIPVNNLAMGLARWKNKLFVMVPRWRLGVASTLNYIDLNANNEKSPALIPYPDWKANTLTNSDDEMLDKRRIVSTYKVQADGCDRLWVMDTGVIDLLGSPQSRVTPALVVFDLHTDRLLRRYEFKPTDITNTSFYANLVVDITGGCNTAHAYVADVDGFAIVVYSWAADDSWQVTHNYFHFDPFQGDFNVAGINFQWTDGIFGLALSNILPNGYRKLYFQTMVGSHVFSIGTEVLRNRTFATNSKSYHLYKIEGHMGPLTQSAISDIDSYTEVLFLTQLNRDGVACWNTKKPLNPSTFKLVAQDREKLIYPNDLIVDKDRNLWVLSDKMPVFLYQTTNPDVINYRILKGRVDSIIANTPCAFHY